MSSPRVERAAAAAAASRLSDAVNAASHGAGGSGTDGFAQLLELAGGNTAELGKDANDRKNSSKDFAASSTPAQKSSTDDRGKTEGSPQVSLASDTRTAREVNLKSSTHAATTEAAAAAGEQNAAPQFTAAAQSDDTDNAENAVSTTTDSDTDQATSDETAPAVVMSQEEIAALVVAQTLAVQQAMATAQPTSVDTNAENDAQSQTTEAVLGTTVSTTNRAVETATEVSTTNRAVETATDATAHTTATTVDAVTTDRDAARAESSVRARPLVDLATTARAAPTAPVQAAAATAVAATAALGSASRSDEAPKNPTRDVVIEESETTTAISALENQLLTQIIDPRLAARSIDPRVAQRETGAIAGGAAGQENSNQNLRGIEALFAMSARSTATGKLETQNSASLARLAERSQQLAAIREQANNAALTAIRHGPSDSELQLDPPEMGRIAIRIITERDQVHVAFFAEKPITKEALERDFSSLRNLLQGSQLQLGNAFVDMSSGQNTWANQLAEWRKLYDGVLAPPTVAAANALSTGVSGGVHPSRRGELDARV